MSGGPPEFREGTASMESAGETDNEGVGGTASARNVLLGGGPVSITIWGRDLGLVGGNVLEAGGSARALPKANNGA